MFCGRGLHVPTPKESSVNTSLLCVELRRDLSLKYLLGLEKGAGHGARNQASTYILCKVAPLSLVLAASLPQLNRQDSWSRSPLKWASWCSLSVST